MRLRQTRLENHSALAIAPGNNIRAVIRRSAFGMDNQAAAHGALSHLQGAPESIRCTRIGRIGAVAVCFDADLNSGIFENLDLPRLPLLRLLQRVVQASEQGTVAHDIAQCRQAVVLTVDQRPAPTTVLGNMNRFNRSTAAIALWPRLLRFEQLSCTFRQGQRTWVMLAVCETTLFNE